MEGGRVDSHASTNRARGLVLLLLTRLDAASSHIDDLRYAFESEDADRAVMMNVALQRAWSDAYMAILILEQLSRCKETNARNALAKSRQRGYVPRILAWNIISRLPNEHRNTQLRDKCKALSI